MTEILFVSPPTPDPLEHRSYSVNAPPLGICYLAAVLREAGYSVAGVELAFAQDPFEELKKSISEHDPRVIGFHTATVNYYLTEKLLRVARDTQTDAITWVGGPHVTYEYETALLHSGFDVVFLFEAEDSALEVANCQLRGQGKLDEIRGIAYKKDRQIVKTQSRPRQKVLDTIPYPARDLFPIEQYSRPGTIMSSRGCPIKCIFCIASTFEDAYRYRSPENVIGELKEMYKTWGIDDFYFVDNVFTTHRSRASKICQLLREENLPIGWYCVSRVDYVTPVLMQELASAGCYRIELGVESANIGVIDTMKKRIKLEQVYRAADIIQNLGMQPMFTFQVGHPDDTQETIEATLRLAEELRNRGAGTYLGITTPYPGTPLMLDREKYKLHLETQDWEDFRWTNPTYSTANFSRNDLRKAVYRDAVAVQRAVAEGKQHDPTSAPWIRFASDHEGVSLPSPPTLKDIAAPLHIEDRKPESPAARISLPVLQVSR
ncbi:MAG: radical SAM protein [Pseudomonadota bacterium]